MNAQKLIFDFEYTKLKKIFPKCWLHKLSVVNDFEHVCGILILIEKETGDKVIWCSYESERLQSFVNTEEVERTDCHFFGIPF